MRWLFYFISLFTPFFAFSIELRDEQKADIREIVLTVVNCDQNLLMQKSESLTPKVMSLMSVASLDLFSFLRSDEELLSAMKQLANDPFKWSMFLQGIQMKMEQEEMQGIISSNISRFAEENSFDEESLRELVERRDWADFITTIISL